MRQVGGVVVVEYVERPGEERPALGDLVRCGNLAPVADGGAKPGRPPRGVAPREQDAAEGLATAGLECRRLVRLDDLAQLLGRPTSQPDVPGGDRDLDLGRQQPHPRPLVPGLVAEGRVDRGGGTLDVAFSQPDQGESGLWRAAEPVRLAEGRLGSLEIALEAADLSERV